MQILLVHNYYQQPGGEDSSFIAEQKLLEQFGHTVVPYTVHNDSINNMSKLQVSISTIWNQHTYQTLKQTFKDTPIALAHFQNTFPLISPSAYYAARHHGVGVIQTLRNYRLLCVNGNFIRNEKVCEKCLNTFAPWPGVVHACYRNSRAASSVLAGMLTVHRMMGTWQNLVDAYIALTEFARNKYIEGGLPAHKIHVKPNFLNSDPGQSDCCGEYALFMGRLSEEKGLKTLLNAWNHLGGIPLKIAGSGPLEEYVQSFVNTHSLSNVALLGHLDSAKLLAVLKGARCLILPSECYEGFPRTILEAFACGIPVIASNTGAMSEVITHEITGLHFEPGAHEELVAQVERLWSDSNLQNTLSAGGRAEYEQKYTTERNYQLLMRIYQTVLDQQKA